MACRTIHDDAGRGVGIACGKRGGICASPGCYGREAALCDFPVGKDPKTGKAKTCDRKMCGRCRRPQPRLGVDVDYCRIHDELALNVAHGICALFGWPW